MATIFTVTNLNDSGAGSLRQAIFDANANIMADEIAFDTSLSGGTINLSSRELIIADDLTLNGLGANFLTLDAGGNSRVFNVDDGDFSNLIDVDIEGLTITGGNADLGGGIFNSENLSVTNSTLSDNTASFSGGGIFNSGNLSVTNSTLSDNTARFGGGIESNGALSVTNSTVSGNTARFGGGIESYGALSATVTNSTVSGNTANIGGGIYNFNLFGDANMTVTSTIIAANTNNNDVDGTFTSGGNNLIGNGDGSIGFTQPTDQIGTTANPINPLLGPLANNGGPTQTQALLPGSPAIDRGSNPLGLQFDQRGPGFERTEDGNGDGILVTDVGAFEVQQQPPTQVPEGDPTFGLLGLAMLGTVFLRKRQQRRLLKEV